ncbi:hypothetical protein IV203_018368 [Nitzschia inconspicua]|uniref:Uncharacterized protein n=1 Tax=Nitzschia inconspicua TaxID=303405 RepID=A0A9K3M2P4_9STRA|nr:hypothetical protein IV203_018368 [Nitzschia inconspicua]
MYKLRMSKHVLKMRTFLVVLLFGSYYVHGQYDCNVCQNSPYGQRTLKSPSKIFVMENGQSWKCGQLQEFVQDVRPSASREEALFCRDYQVIAEIYGCSCNGPAVDSLLNGPFKDVNPPCQLCARGDFNYVPSYMVDEAIQIPGWGVVNCGGLFNAALTGNIFNSDNCAEVTPYFSAGCCSFPNSSKIGLNNNNFGPAPSPSTTSVSGTCAHKACSSNEDCCSGYTCRASISGRVCSKQVFDRDRISSGAGAVRGGHRQLRRGAQEASWLEASSH